MTGVLLPTPMAAGEGGGLLFYEDDGRVVFTNTPSRSDVRPVPGLEVWRTIEFDDPRLPVTIYDPFIENVARENGLSAALIKAVALAESGFDPHAVSPKGAQGLMQLMPETARQYGVEDAFDPLQNLRAGALHLRGLLDEFDGDLTLALAAYNAGAGAVKRHGGVPNYRETKEYVRKVRTNLAQERRGRRTAAPAESAPTVKLVQSADGTIKLVN